MAYEDIVRNWYDKLRPDFVNLLLSNYKSSKMRLEDAENIYQDIFIAIYDNLEQGRIHEDTAWQSYIMRIGMNMASKKYRKIGITDSISSGGDDDDPQAPARKIEEILRQIPQEDLPLIEDPQTHALLGEELTHTPEPCASLIRLHYFAGLKDAEIVEEMPRYGSAASVKVIRNRCMKELVYRVKLALFHAGIIDTKPEKDTNKKGGSK